MIIGATHLLVGDKILKSKGFDCVKQDLDLSTKLYEVTDKDLVFDKNTVIYLHKRVDREKAFLENNNLDEKWTNATQMQIQNLKRFINKVEAGEIKIDS